MEKKKILEDLTIGYIRGELSDEEKIILEKLLQDKRNKSVFDYLVKLDYISNLENLPDKIGNDKVYKKIIRRVRLRKAYMLTIKYAASILILIVSYYAIEKSFFKNNIHKPINGLKTDSVILVINNEKPIKLPLERASINYQYLDSLKAVHAQKNARLGEDSFVNNYKVVVPNGSIFKITLSDGTKVWLNSESELSYPELFTGKKRMVTLSGEGYFEVAHLNNYPFYVKTNSMNVRVLGTKFNIRSYDSLQIATLKEGLVSIHLNDRKDSILLNPNFQLIYNKKTNKVHQHIVNTENFLSWTNNRIVIRDRLTKIFNELSRIYKFEVSYSDDDLKEIVFHLDVERYPSINQVLEKLAKTNAVKIKIDSLSRIRVYR